MPAAALVIHLLSTTPQPDLECRHVRGDAVVGLPSAWQELTIVNRLKTRSRLMRRPKLDTMLIGVHIFTLLLSVKFLAAAHVIFKWTFILLDVAVDERMPL